MSEIKINVSGLENLGKALENLSKTLENLSKALVGQQIDVIEPGAEPAKEDITPETEATEPSYNLAQVQRAFKDMAPVIGKDEMKAILADFNAKKLSDVPEDQYNALMERLAKAVNEA